MSVQLARRSYSRTDFHRMVAAGILAPDDRVELIDGEVVEMGPIGSRHAVCIDRLAALFWQRLGKRVVVRVQNPLVLGPRTEVHPNLCLVRNRDDYYARRHPGAGDVLLVVEVAETSAEIDRTVKIPLYERRSVPEVWLVDLRAEIVEVYLEPVLRRYPLAHQVERGGVLSPSAFPRTRFAVDDILGPGSR